MHLSLNEIWSHYQFKLLVGAFLIFLIFYELLKGYFKNVGTGVNPALFKRSLSILLCFSVSVVGVLFLDSILREKIQSFHGSYAQFFLSFGKLLSKQIWMGLIALYFIGFITNLERFRKMVFGALLSGAVTGLISHGLKHIFLRARPEGNLGHFSFFNLDGLLRDKHVFQSFPSGDVAVVAGAAFYFFYAVKNNFVRWFFILLPFINAYFRVSVNRHWPSDTLMSIGIGLIVAQLIHHYEKREIFFRSAPQEDQPHRLSVNQERVKSSL